MKVVINKCYGGFGISIEALFKLINMKSDLVDCMSCKKYYGNDGYSSVSHYKEDWYADHSVLINKKQNKVYFLNESMPKYAERSHKDMIEVVESLGSEANGDYAELKIVDIPDDIEWEIEEYDGIEWVSERHRVWG